MSRNQALISTTMMLLLIMGHGPTGLLAERPPFHSSVMFGADDFFLHDRDRYAIRATFHKDLNDRGARLIEATFYCPRGSAVSSCSLEMTTYLNADDPDALDPRRWRIDFSYDRRVLHMTIYSEKKHCIIPIEMPYATYRTTFANLIGIPDYIFYGRYSCTLDEEFTAEELSYERETFQRAILGPAHSMFTTILDHIVNDNPYARVTLRDVVPGGTEILDGGIDMIAPIEPTSL